MIRKIIEIDKEKCNGCGACTTACHEGAIGMQNGKAELLRDDYCDGLGDCLPACPTGAIRFIEREAAAYDAAAVARNQKKNVSHLGGCPGTHMRQMKPRSVDADLLVSAALEMPSQLGQWPCQIRLVPVNAPYFDGAHLLIAADCTAYAYAGMHRDFMAGKITLIGCPKLDSVDYREKLTEILRQNEIADLTIVRMEVPCCGGLENAAKEALLESGKMIPWQVATISVDGKLLKK